MEDRVVDLLMDRAKEAAGYAYVPYSGYPIGASLITKSGEVFSGCNIENMSFGATVCAERVAILKAVSEGHTDISAILIYHAGEDMPYPCGMCRQMLAEFNMNAEVAAANDYKFEVYTLRELLPFAFEAEELQK